MIETSFPNASSASSAAMSVEKATLAQEISICRQKILFIKGILFGEKESEISSEKEHSFIDELIDEMKIINANLEDIYIALSSLK